MSWVLFMQICILIFLVTVCVAVLIGNWNNTRKPPSPPRQRIRWEDIEGKP